MLTLGSSLFQETDALTAVRDSIRTLLGPRPHLNPILGSGGSGAKHEIELQKSALIAYRARIVALIEMLEGGVKVPGSEPKTAGRKPIAAAGSAKAPKHPAA